MKHVDEYRDPAMARALSEALAAEVPSGRRLRLMEFCGGHTHALARHGVDALLPPSVAMVHGPGCPVCVLPIGRIDQAIALARDRGAMVCTYGDTMRVPASGGVSLLQARAEGADVRVIASPADALRLASAHPGREVVLFAIGFETTTPPTALALQTAWAQRIANFSVLCCHVLTSAALAHVVRGSRDADADVPPLDGVVGPGHVAVITGVAPFDRLARDLRIPIAVAGFEPLDLLHAVRHLLRQITEGRNAAVNAYPRAVTAEGNRRAQALVDQVLEPREAFEWRGLGTLPHSALRPRAAYAAHDAERRFALPCHAVPDPPACRCAAVLRGAESPTQCRLFGTACTPAHPIGPCMVSSEGACAAHHARARRPEHRRQIISVAPPLVRVSHSRAAATARAEPVDAPTSAHAEPAEAPPTVRAEPVEAPGRAHAPPDRIPTLELSPLAPTHRSAN
jgi:hydrogenase expression/formation protein HypD